MSNNNSYTLKNRGILFLLGAIVPLEYRLASQMTGFISISTGEVLVFGLFVYWLLNKEDVNINSFDNVLFQSLLPVMLYCFWSIFSLAITPDVEGFQVVRDILTVSIFYILLINYIDSYDGIRRVLSGFCFGVILNLIICLPQIIFDWPRPISLNVSGANLKESLDGGVNFNNVATGLFAHPNGLAPHICIAVIIFFGFIFSSSSTKSKMIAWFAIAVSTIVLYFTFAKGALLWLSIGLITFFLRRFIPKNMRFVYSVSLIAFVVAVIVMVVIPYQIEEGGGGTVETRMILWSVLGDVIDDNFWGATFGGNQKAMLNMSGFYSSFEYPDAHNTYLNQIVYFGIVGFILFLWFLFDSLKKAITIEVSSYDQSDVLWVVILFLFGYIFFEPMHQSLNELGLVYMVCGLAAAGAHIGIKENGNLVNYET